MGRTSIIAVIVVSIGLSGYFLWRAPAERTGGAGGLLEPPAGAGDGALIGDSLPGPVWDAASGAAAPDAGQVPETVGRGDVGDAGEQVTDAPREAPGDATGDATGPGGDAGADTADVTGTTSTAVIEAPPAIPEAPLAGPDAAGGPSGDADAPAPDAAQDAGEGAAGGVAGADTPPWLTEPGFDHEAAIAAVESSDLSGLRRRAARAALDRARADPSTRAEALAQVRRLLRIE